MNERYEQAYKRIRGVKGAFIGGIIIRNFKQICHRNELTPEEIKQLETQLRSEGFLLITDDQKDSVYENIQENKFKPKSQTEENNNVSLTDAEIMKIAEKISFEPNWSKESLCVAKILIRNAICRFCNSIKMSRGAEIVAAALVNIGIDVSKRRLEKCGRRGWSCGTYASKIANALAEELKFKYSADRLNCLAIYCNNRQVDDEFMESMLICLIKDIKPVLVHSALDFLSCE